MRKSISVLLIGVMFALTACNQAWAQTDFRFAQYKAAKTFYFLSFHKAFPIFSLSPVSPTDTVNVATENVAVRGRTCFPSLNSPEGAIRRPASSASSSVSVATGAGFEANASIEMILTARFGVDFNLSEFTRLKFSPIEKTDLTIGTLELERHLKIDSDACKTVLQVIHRGVPNLFLVSTVFYSPVEFRNAVSVAQDAELNFNPSEPVRVLLEPILKTPEGLDLSLAYEHISGDLIGTTESVPQAIRPAFINTKAAAKIAYYLQGERGAELESDVLDAIGAKRASAFKRLWRKIRELFYSNEYETAYRQLFTGNNLGSPQEVSSSQYRAIAVVGAAKVLADVEVRELER